MTMSTGGPNPDQQGILAYLATQSVRKQFEEPNLDPKQRRSGQGIFARLWRRLFHAKHQTEATTTQE